MPDESKARLFELSHFRPRFESLIYALAWGLPACMATFHPLLIALMPCGGFLAFGLQICMDRVRPTLTMGADGFSIRSRAQERFVPWADFVCFEKAPRGIIALTRDGWVPLGRTGVTFDEARQRLIREHKPHETLKQLEEAAQHWRQERAKPRTLRLLETHDEEQWPTILEKAAQSGFRTSGITQANLRDDLLSPNTPPPLRELLAETLKIRVEEDAIEETIETFASARSKAVLRSLLANAD